MGGIETDQNCETRIKGLFAVGECSSVGLHGANRLGSNSTAELVVFGRLAGEQATERAATAGNGNEAAIEAQAAGVEQRLKDLVNGMAAKTGRRSATKWARQWKKVAVSTVRRN